MKAHRVAAAALRVFDTAGDDFGRYRTLRLLAQVEWVQGHVTAADNAWRRAAVHARAAGDEREFFEILAGARPPRSRDRHRSRRESRPAARSVSKSVSARFRSRHAPATRSTARDAGRVRRGSLAVYEANAILDDLGRMHSAVSHHEAMVEILAGDHAQAEERLQLGFARLDEIGEKALLATTAALLARVTYAQGRYGEAERSARSASARAQSTIPRSRCLRRRRREATRSAGPDPRRRGARPRRRCQ